MNDQLPPDPGPGNGPAPDPTAPPPLSPPASPAPSPTPFPAPSPEAYSPPAAYPAPAYDPSVYPPPASPAGAHPGYPQPGYAAYPPPPGYGYPQAPPYPGYAAPGMHVFAGGAEPPMNGFAVASLVCGVWGIFPLGFLFGVIALVQISRRRQRGNWLAIVGLIASAFYALIIGAVVALALAAPGAFDSTGGYDGSGTGSGSGSGSGTRTTTTSADLYPGVCIENLQEYDQVDDLEIVPCTDPHRAEVYTVFTLDDGTYPGEDAVIEEAEERCGNAFDRYSDGNEDLEIYYYYPSSALEWALDRGVSCIAVDPTATRTDSIVN
ncbi:septum formation family protein [Actinoplanes sp. NPDC051851]|uniref:DUF4190 domain-containing protein n=1 Tax=Actinoplanes sp. NPDC051851 TaxID=3154753 RepID=UPI003428512C